MRIRIIDAFTDRPFTGNPAAVCLLDGESWPDEGWMRRVAAEVLAKVETFNPGNAIKDRIAVSMLADAEERGIVNKETLIVEPTLFRSYVALDPSLWWNRRALIDTAAKRLRST